MLSGGIFRSLHRIERGGSKFFSFAPGEKTGMMILERVSFQEFCDEGEQERDDPGLSS